MQTYIKGGAKVKNGLESLVRDWLKGHEMELSDEQVGRVVSCLEFYIHETDLIRDCVNAL